MAVESVERLWHLAECMLEIPRFGVLDCLGA